MKKFIALGIVFLSTIIASHAEISFSDAVAHSAQKPALILVNAKWASGYQSYLNDFKSIQNEFGTAMNYVELDLTKVPNADAFEFNKNYFVYTNLPYVIMLRNNGMICRYIPNDCAGNYSCMKSKVNAFLKK